MFEMKKEEMDSLLDSILHKHPVTILFPGDIHTREVILYGAGNLAVLAVKMLKPAGVHIRYIIDNNSALHGKEMDGIAIRSPDDISSEDKKALIFIVCVVTYPYELIRSRLNSLGCIGIYPFYDYCLSLKDRLVSINSWICPSLAQDDILAIRSVYNSFADDKSRAAYLQVLYWRILREEIIFNDLPVSMQDKFFPSGIMPALSPDEVLLDCGAYTGNTIEAFLQKAGGQCKKIFAYEPDQENFIALRQYLGSLGGDLRTKIFAYPAGMGEVPGNFPFIAGDTMASRFSESQGNSIVRKVTIDDEMKNEEVSFIKIHAEGDELSVLRGGLKTILRCRPILVITIYHSEEGLWRLPRYLMENLTGYVFYHRIHAFCGIESVLYAFPKERILKQSRE